MDIGIQRKSYYYEGAKLKMNYDIREWQLFELSILEKVVAICEKYDIQYFLSSGTLLGAVRHKGFIPWDDDVDIDMPIKEYKRFCKIPQEEFESVGLFLQTYKTDSKFSASWAQIRANNTTSMPVANYQWDIHWGVCIDIFPLIGLYENPTLRKLQYKLFGINYTLLSKDYYNSVPHTEYQISKKVKLMYMLPRFIRHTIVALNDLLVDRDFFSSREGTVKWWNLSTKYSPEYYTGSTKVLFEGRLYNAPRNYDGQLTLLYGDYMTLPPESEREGHEMILGDIIKDLNKDYKEYQEELRRGLRA